MVKLGNGGIKDILPANLITPETLSISHAFEQAQKKMLGYAQALHLYTEIGQVPERILDLLALEMGAQYYEQDMPRKTKERLGMQTLVWYMHAGTPSVLDEFLATVLEGGYTEEWYTYGGEPYHFRAYARAGDGGIPLGYGAKAKRYIETYRNIRSWLEFLMFIIWGGARVTVGYKSLVTFGGEFTPCGNARLKLDGKWKLDGRWKLRRYEDADNRYPSSIMVGMRAEAGVGMGSGSFTAGMGIRPSTSSMADVTFTGMAVSAPTGQPGLTVGGRTGAGVHMGGVRVTVSNLLDGKWGLDGKRKLNGGLYLG